MAGHPTFLAWTVLFGWIPVIVMFFAVLPAQRAMVVGAITAWVLLPPLGVDLPGLPVYDKTTAACGGILLATLIFDIGQLLAFRPRWFDLPILLFCVCPFATSISNDLGPYDGLSAAFHQMAAWLLPYLIGRLYLTDIDSLRQLAIGMIISGICLIPFCLLEMRISAVLQQSIYGTGRFEGIRDGSYRPRVFFWSGLELGLWMNSTALLAWWLWRTGLFRSLWGLPSGGLVPVLMAVAFLCRARGATLLALAGGFTLWACTRFKTKWVLWGLLAVAPTYYLVSITRLWTGQNLVEWVETNYSKERATSLQARFTEEKVLIARAMKRPILGWGGYNRARVIEDDVDDSDVWVRLEDGVRYTNTVNSLWTIVLGTQGLVGLVTMTIAMTLPVMLFLGRFPVERWGHPDLAAVPAMSVILSLFLLDGLANAMLNPIYLIIAGGLLNIVPARTRPQASEHDDGRRAVGVRLVSSAPGTTADRRSEAAIRALESRESLAVRYQDLGRTSKVHGRLTEARAAWRYALDILTELTTVQPENPTLRRRWCNCANDLAWLLTSAADPAVRDPVGAVALAVKTVEVDPTCSTYWNTLGAAHYRAGNPHATVDALNQAVAISDGGTAFDHFFLAMAHARLGDREDARRWFDLAMIEMDHYPPGHAELRRLHDEAGSVVPIAAAASH